MTDLWEKLKECDKPIVLYGTGNGAEKIKNELDRRGISIRGVFASDDFVRNKTFFGFPVTSYAEKASEFGRKNPDGTGGMIVLVCFGTDRKEVIGRILGIAEEQELYFPDVPVVPGECFDGRFFEEHMEEIDRVRSVLADETSIRTFDSVIAYKLSGDISHLFHAETEPEEPWDLMDLYGDEIYVDLGAYTGDTIHDFLDGVWRNAPDASSATFRSIIALEPDRRNFRKLEERMRRFQGLAEGEPLPESIELYQTAASDREEVLLHNRNAGRGSGIGSGTGNSPAENPAVNPAANPTGIRYAAVPVKNAAGVGDDTVPAKAVARVTENAAGQKSIQIPATSVDRILDGRAATVIKMDVEGAERKAIRGAEKTIRTYKPRLLIAGYHRSEDLFRIPLEVLALNPEYRVCLRKSPCLPAWELNYIFI